MEYTTHLELHSQTTRLFASPCTKILLATIRGSHPPRRPVPRHFRSQKQNSLKNQLQITTPPKRISNSSFCRFTRRY
ncbi:DEKNAAC104789 [Brettanomyces naardenensis]|uniref:DEKNAAC104789 n=1 Tax=Brettanomyces naardenensis TaxID=13370 RepID=A0A448YRU8_BRENA|nr:DEKNAAC104789 [Brettanomyces naardenensis]